MKALIGSCHTLLLVRELHWTSADFISMLMVSANKITEMVHQVMISVSSLYQSNVTD